VYVHRLLLPHILRLEFAQPLSKLRLLDSSSGEDSFDGSGVGFTCRTGQISPFLLAACLGISLHCVCTSTSNTTTPLRIVDRTFLAALSSVFGDVAGSNEVTLTSSELCVVITRYMAVCARNLLVDCSASDDEVGSEVGAMAAVVIQDSSTEVTTHQQQQQVKTRKHEVSKANKALLGLLDNCSDLLHMICGFLLPLSMQLRGGNISATLAFAKASELVNLVVSTVSLLCNEVSASCMSVEQETNSDVNKFSVEMKKTEIDEGVNGSMYGDEKNDEEATGESLVRQKHHDRQVQFDKRKRKSVHSLGRVLKVLRGVLEGQRSSKAD
jgi:hypothetical protein